MKKDEKKPAARKRKAKDLAAPAVVNAPINEEERQAVEAADSATVARQAPKEYVVRRATAAEQRMYATKPVVLLGLDEVGDMLTASAFMRPWIKKRILEALRLGEFFELEREGTPMAEYRLATKQEAIDLATQGIRPQTLKQSCERQATSGAPQGGGPAPASAKKPKVVGTIRAARSGTEFVFALPALGKAFDKATDGFPPQARKLLEIIIESKQDRLNIDALEHVLESGKAAKGILEIVPVLGRFKRFYNEGTFGPLVTKEEK